MFQIFLEQTLFLSALSAIVLALFWPHISPFVMALFRKLHNLYRNNDSSHKKYPFIVEHPRFSGRALKKRTSSDRESIGSTLRSFGGYAQSSLGGNPSFLAAQYASASGSPTSALPGGSNGTPASLFTLFSACVIGLIVYTMFKMFTSKLSPTNRSTGCRRRTTAKDIAQDRRKLMRMNRDDRVKQLILHHGGKNVSAAIKFLVVELEKQKQLLYDGLIESNNPRKSHCCFHDKCHTLDSCPILASNMSEASHPGDTLVKKEVPHTWNSTEEVLVMKERNDEQAATN